MSAPVDVLAVDGRECELVRVSDPQPWHPKWELFAPEGFVFSGGESSLLFVTKAQAKRTASQESLEPEEGA
jgi:hypothetical protein